MEFALNVFLIFCIFAIGSLFGSFFSLAIYRIPRKEDIIHSRSYCPNCKHKLEFLDLIPVLSYIFHGAKCKYCGEKINIRYFLLEIGNGMLFILLYLIFGYTIKLAIIVVIYAVIFVLIGSYMMKLKMIKDEAKNIDLKQHSSIKLNKKSGVFISELVIALILFIATFITIIVVNRNTRSKVNSTLIEANANTLLLKNIEICLLADYDKLGSYTLTEDIGGIRYNVLTTVNKLSDNDNSKKDIVKQIEVKISYNFNNENYELSMKTLKGKV